jgi:hypothetical protein
MGVGGQCYAPAPLSPVRILVHTVQEAGCAAGRVWTIKKFLTGSVTGPKKKITAEKSEINTGNHGMKIRHRSMCWLAVHGVVWKWVTKFLK